jgi:hypothetical protein
MLPPHHLLLLHPSSSLWQPDDSSYHVSGTYNRLSAIFSAFQSVTLGLAAFFLGAMLLSMNSAAPTVEPPANAAALLLQACRDQKECCKNTLIDICVGSNTTTCYEAFKRLGARTTRYCFHLRFSSIRATN